MAYLGVLYKMVVCVLLACSQDYTRKKVLGRAHTK